MRAVRSAARAALLAFALALLAPSVAWAHAVLVTSDPADGALLAAPPERLTLTFNEPVSPLVFHLIGPDGAKREGVSVRQEGAALSVDPSGELGNGTHLLSWRVVSADGHPIGGTIVFSVGHASTGGPPPQTAASAALKAAIWLARVVIYAALFVGVGGVFFVCWLGGMPLYAVERVLRVFLLAGLLAVPVSVGLQGADLLGLSLVELSEPGVWQAGFRSRYAVTATFAFAAFFAAQLACQASSRRKARFASAVALAGVGLALAASGHASFAAPRVLMAPAVFAHSLGIAFWIGALLPLAALLLARPREARSALRRFSCAVPFAVAVLIASGAVLSVVQVGEIPALWRTDYGRLLLVKFGLLAVLFSAALYNRVALTGRVLADDSAVGRALTRSIGVELVLAFAIFAVVAGWRFTPPPRALTAAAAPATVRLHAPRAAAEIRFDPGRTGEVSVAIALTARAGGALGASEVTLLLANENAGIEPIRRSAEKCGDAAWCIRHVVIPVPGRWTVRAEILISDFDMIALEGSADFRP